MVEQKIAKKTDCVRLQPFAKSTVSITYPQQDKILYFSFDLLVDLKFIKSEVSDVYTLVVRYDLVYSGI